MSGCTLPLCNAPRISCPLGHVDHTACPQWTKDDPAGEAQASAPAPSNDGYSVPWPGAALNSSDFPVISARGAPRVVSIVGAANAGKTTLLSAWYLLLSRGALGTASKRFAGSFTLEGWEHIAHNLRWDNDGGPAFPVHTPSGVGRQPGMLHLALRRADGLLEDVLFSDAPGEWFRAWAIDKDATLGVGARWLSAHADAIVVVADCEALSGPTRGQSRGILQHLIHRIADERRGRPVTVVWTKSDKAVPEGIRADIEDHIRTHLGSPSVFEVSVYPRDGVTTEPPFVELLEWALAAPAEHAAAAVPTPSLSDPFLAYGHV